MSDEIETLKPEDFVGWTVEVKDNAFMVPDGIYYCVSARGIHGIQLRKHGHPTNPNPEEKMFINYWTGIDYGVTRLEKGDHAP